MIIRTLLACICMLLHVDVKWLDLFCSACVGYWLTILVLQSFSWTVLTWGMRFVRAKSYSVFTLAFLHLSRLKLGLHQCHVNIEVFFLPCRVRWLLQTCWSEIQLCVILNSIIIWLTTLYEDSLHISFS